MDNLLSQYQSNVFPEMVEQFAKSLGLTAKPFIELGIGYIPNEGCWVSPERDTAGKVTGLCRRYSNGKKYMVGGGSRGYVYSINPGYSAKKYDHTKYHWVRCTSERVCPICDKPDWCMVSSDNPDNPGAVLCSRVQKGSKKEIGSSGYLHIRRRQDVSENTTLLVPSNDPVVIVEGMTDWAAATHLGFTAIGRPSATFVAGNLSRLVNNRDVIIVGDNDPNGIGAVGADKVNRAIKSAARVVTTVFPPDEVKDLREWVADGLTKDHLLSYADQFGSKSQYTVLPSNNALDLAEAWLTANHNLATTLSLRKHRGQWYRYKDNSYSECDVEHLRGDMWEYFSDKNYLKITPKGEVIEPIIPTKTLISNAIDALNRWCHIDQLPPVWLAPRLQHLDPAWVIVFRNGILDVKKFVHEGCTKLIPPTPELFTLSCLPYDYNPKATCPYADSIIWDLISEDVESWKLLWEWFGYNTIPNQIFEKLMMLVGEPGSGKGTIITLLVAMLGERQCASTTFLKMGKDFGFHPLLGKLSAIMPDGEISRNVDAGSAMENIKAITGRDPVGVNRKIKDELGLVKLFCRFTIAVNRLPDLPDQAKALERRMNMLIFDKSYNNEVDPELKDRVTRELPGVMNRALEGLARLVKNMKFTVPERSKQMMGEFIMITTPMATFLEDCCVMGEDQMCPKPELFDCWSEWSRKSGMRPGTVMKLQQRLLSYSGSIRSDRQELNGDSTAIYRGLSLNRYGESLIGA